MGTHYFYPPVQQIHLYLTSYSSIKQLLFECNSIREQTENSTMTKNVDNYRDGGSSWRW